MGYVHGLAFDDFVGDFLRSIRAPIWRTLPSEHSYIAIESNLSSKVL